MPTKNVTSFARAANRAAEERDPVFWLGVPIGLAAGGVVGAELAEWAVKQVTGFGMNTDTGRTVIGVSKVLTGAAFVGVADEMFSLSSYPGAIVALAGLGSAFAGGADLYGVISGNTPLPDLLSPNKGRRSSARRRLKRAAPTGGSSGSSGSAGTSSTPTQMQRTSNMSANRGSTPSAYS